MPAEAHAAERERRVRLLAPGLYAVRQRSWSGLTVALYVLEGPDGLTLIDAGFPNRAHELEEALASLGQRLEAVARVVYTHTHIDHMGGGPALAELTRAEHVIWHESVSVAEDWQAHQRRMTRWGAWLDGLVPEGPMREAMRAMGGATRSARRAEWEGPTRIAPVRPLWPGERVEAGRYALEALPAPGHDPYHVVLWDRDARVAFSGDVVLPVPTPIAPPMGDDTGTYLETLARLESLPVATAYPGHGAPIGSWSRRVAHSRGFVEERHAAILARLGEGGPQTRYELGRAVAGRLADDLARFPLILANVDSSVHYLLARGELAREGERIRLA
jgi:glyoxylase-like metal-dependent hydrolase (beta-lactamase superfamily II)